ncbi:thiol reductant ABC exporter subunit CydC [Mesobacterium pallidum]|uniref:thiol reductant ABC exporter subunit CydC n=1 Tax=Mesobacterium pallidum TaxID=2872037 RepID=UPI001EE30073|nr:thiol reductant ABC exporter subunit CydC [Mesobacterium pallidum]
MRRLCQIAATLWRADPWAMARGAAAALAVLMMGAALLGLSGWFVTAAAAAGLAGIGVAFDVFRPSAGVRFLALGRAGARYAERLLTHDATLRALAALRLTLLRQMEGLPVDTLRRMRSAGALTRVTADVDALDGLVLRLVLPALAALVTLLGAGLMLWWLVGLGLALAVASGVLVFGVLVLGVTLWLSTAPARRAEQARQALRHASMGLFRGHRDVIQQGRLPLARAQIDTADAEARTQEDHVARVDEGAGLALSLLIALAGTAALWLGGQAVAAGTLDPARAAIGLFVALALAEALMPLRRGVTELGRMLDAASRIDPTVAEETLEPRSVTPRPGAILALRDVTVTAPDRIQPLFEPLTLTLAPGDWVALTGASGSGKSSLLDVIAGLRGAAGGEILLSGLPLADWPEAQLRQHVTLLPQRALLVGGTIRENLALARDDLDDTMAWEVLRTVCLDHVIEQAGGLGAVLGEGGTGLSGGETRRLALARALLRRPALLLLDEPTEGLDDATARQVLTNIRAALPRAAVLMASHRAAERGTASRVVDMKYLGFGISHDPDQTVPPPDGLGKAQS